MLVDRAIAYDAPTNNSLGTTTIGVISLQQRCRDIERERER
jgi:hypothetical protein